MSQLLGIDTMQNYDSAFAPVQSINLLGSPLSITDLVLLVVSLVAVLVALYSIAKFISTRPAVSAIGSITAIIAGLTALLSGEVSTGLSITITGTASLMLCALSYSRNNQPVRGK